nr:BadF/BadG/BcrA/BcrD ATPase family protein [Thalassobacillus sp. CUG 92003]
MAVDGGNSKTHAVIVNEQGEMLGEGRAEGTNYQTVGNDTFLNHLREAIYEALDQGRLQIQDIDFTQYGLAGADREKDFRNLRSLLGSLPFPDWSLECDTLQGLRIDNPGHAGVVLICGAGTNAAGRTENGETIQIGGFGYRYGDAAGGAYIALQAFRAAVRSWEGRGEKTILEKTLPSGLGFQNMKALYDFALDNPKYSIPLRVTLTVHEAADSGDEKAVSILKQVGKELGRAGIAVVNHLPDLKRATVPIVLNGSILQQGKNQYLMESLTTTLQRADFDSRIINRHIAPVYGSVMLAFDQLGIESDASIVNRWEGVK